VGIVSVGIVVKDDGSNEVKLSGCVVLVDCVREGDGCIERKGDEVIDSALDEGSLMDGDISDLPEEAGVDVPDIFVYASASDESELGF
jgi:hypothetical protein